MYRNENNNRFSKKPDCWEIC